MSSTQAQTAESAAAEIYEADIASVVMTTAVY